MTAAGDPPENPAGGRTLVVDAGGGGEYDRPSAALTFRYLASDSHSAIQVLDSTCIIRGYHFGITVRDHETKPDLVRNTYRNNRLEPNPQGAIHVIEQPLAEIGR